MLRPLGSNQDWATRKHNVVVQKYLRRGQTYVWWAAKIY